MMETAADPDKLRQVAKRLWVFANQMRETAEILSYPTGDLDAGVLEDGALEDWKRPRMKSSVCVSSTRHP
jgi:hypothetical protein